MIKLCHLPFCLMEFQSSKLIYNNFHYFPEYQGFWPHQDDLNNNNLYSSILAKHDIEDLDKVFHWIETIKLSPPRGIPEIENRCPVLTIDHNNLKYHLKFSIYLGNKQSPLFLILHLIPEDQINHIDQENRRIFMDQLEQCHRGLSFGEAFFNYSVQDIAILANTISMIIKDNDLIKLPDLESSLDRIKKIGIWLQLHQMVDTCFELQEILEQMTTQPESSLKSFHAFQETWKTFDSLVAVTNAVASYSRYRKDIGYFRIRRSPLGMEERQYQEMIKDFEILQQLIHYDNPNDLVRKHADKCMGYLKLMDKVVLNQTLGRLKSIAADLSHELGKCLRFHISCEWIIVTNHYAQHLICRYLINVLRYLIVEHLELPKEREMTKKHLVSEILLKVEQDDHNVYIIYEDNGFEFDMASVVERALEKKLITETMSEWMLDQGRENVYNLMLKQGFGPPVKPPPNTLYEQHLSLIYEESSNLQGHMTFVRRGPYNVVKLRVPKQSNGILLFPKDQPMELGLLRL
ncbi:MAG: hypothetical protein HQM12_17295 [SAR324 cluster bacterium]|nr:hypothetical protein [SAR324 cluster bacterium]